jgi:hypothetical protein
MIERGAYAGVEIGFIGRIASIMMQGNEMTCISASAMELPYDEFVKAAF